jgi:DNA-binding transcriptional LysR family regulator
MHFSDPKIPPSAAILARLKTRQIQLLLALETSRSLRKAAIVLNTTQPAATKLLQELESTLGVELFERTRRGLQPNEYGEVMIRHARLLVSDLDHARNEIAALASGATGTLKIGAVVSAIPFLIARAVTALKSKQPRLMISVDVGTSDVLVTSLMRGDLDLLVARPVAARRPEFNYEQLIEEPLVVVGRSDHPLIDASSLSFADVATRPWVLLPAGSPMRKVLAPLFNEAGLECPEDLIETSSMLTMTVLLRESDRLAVLPEDVARHYVEWRLLARIPVTLPPIMGSYGVITCKDRPFSPAARAFRTCLQQALPEHLLP